MKQTKTYESVSSMEMIFLMLVCLLGGLWGTEGVSVTGVLGKEITIKCSHVNAFANVKYFCKEACENKDVLISSRKKKNCSNEKYSISDDGNTFYVTIFHLTEDDSGTYWCGIDRVGIDTYNKVVLTVIEGKKKESDNDYNDLPQSISNDASKKASSSKKLVYIGAGLGVVVLALAVVLPIFLRHRSRDISASSEKVHDTVYAKPFCQKHDAHHTTTSSSTANEDQETLDGTNSFISSHIQQQGTSGDHAHNIYSNSVSSESVIQPDSLFYSTVSFYKHTDCSTVTPPTAVVTYATVSYKLTDESTVYCNV